MPSLVGQVIDAITKKDIKSVERITKLYLIINLVSSVFTGLKSVFNRTTTEMMGRSIRLDVFKEIMRKDVEFFDERMTGDLISRLITDT